MKTPSLIIAVVSLLISLPSLAAETDDFTTMFMDIDDSLNTYNKVTNRMLRASMGEANMKEGSCQHKKNLFYHSFLRKVGGYTIAKSEAWSAWLPNIPSIKLPFKKTIFNNTGIEDNVDLGKFSPIERHNFLTREITYTTHVAKINGIKVGSDKVGHFFHVGFEYFEAAKLQHQRNYRPKAIGHLKKGFARQGTDIKTIRGDAQALQVGRLQEDGIYGFGFSGVSSYGDKTANMDGYRFWNDLFENKNPMFRCSNGKIIKQRDFDFRNYITEAWNETINCSKYKDSKVKRLVQKNIDALFIKFKSDKRFSDKTQSTCPVTPAKCKTLVTHYNKISQQYYGNKIDLSQELLHPDCLAIGRPGSAPSNATSH